MKFDFIKIFKNRLLNKIFILVFTIFTGYFFWSRPDNSKTFKKIIPINVILDLDSGKLSTTNFDIFDSSWEIFDKPPVYSFYNTGFWRYDTNISSNIRKQLELRMLYLLDEPQFSYYYTLRYKGYKDTIFNNWRTYGYKRINSDIGEKIIVVDVAQKSKFITVNPSVSMPKFCKVFTNKNGFKIKLRNSTIDILLVKGSSFLVDDKTNFELIKKFNLTNKKRYYVFKNEIHISFNENKNLIHNNYATENNWFNKLLFVYEILRDDDYYIRELNPPAGARL